MTDKSLTDLARAMQSLVENLCYAGKEPIPDAELRKQLICVKGLIHIALQSRDSARGMGSGYQLAAIGGKQIHA